MIHIICFGIWILVLAYLLCLRYKYFQQKSILFVVFFSALGAITSAVAGAFIFFTFVSFIETITQIPLSSLSFSSQFLDTWARLSEVVLVFFGGLFGPLWQINRELNKAAKKEKQF